MYGIGEISARLTQPVFDGFATRSRVRSAKSTLASVKERVLDTTNSLALDGIIAYVDLLNRKEIYRLSEKNVSQHRAIAAMAVDRSISGVYTEADVTQAKSRLARAKASMADAQANLLVEEDTYKRLTGMKAPAKLSKVELPRDKFTEPESVIQIAESNNPQLAALLQDVRIMRGEKELAESAFYPTINAEAGPSYSNRGGASDRWIYSFDIVGTVRWNIFNSGADLAETRAAGARIRQAR